MFAFASCLLIQSKFVSALRVERQRLKGVACAESLRFHGSLWQAESGDEVRRFASSGGTEVPRQEDRVLVTGDTIQSAQRGFLQMFCTSGRGCRGLTLSLYWCWCILEG